MDIRYRAEGGARYRVFLDGEEQEGTHTALHTTLERLARLKHQHPKSDVRAFRDEVIIADTATCSQHDDEGDDDHEHDDDGYLQYDGTDVTFDGKPVTFGGT